AKGTSMAITMLGLSSTTTPSPPTGNSPAPRPLVVTNAISTRPLSYVTSNIDPRPADVQKETANDNKTVTTHLKKRGSPRSQAKTPKSPRRRKTPKTPFTGDRKQSGIPKRSRSPHRPGRTARNRNRKSRSPGPVASKIKSPRKEAKEAEKKNATDE